jgi:threonine/homoserine/homoserine lactone efflux protein
MEMLVPILLVDVLNPVLLAFLIYTAGTRHGVLNSCAGLLGHTIAYFCAGLVLFWGFDSIAKVLANPGVIDYALSTALGLLLLWVAYLASQPDKSKDSAQPEAAPSGLLGVFVAGAVINFIGLPFALPYFAAVDQIIKADLAGAGSLLLLVGYNLAYAAPFLLVPILTAAMGEGSRRILQRVNAWVERGSAVLMPIMLALLGVALLADGISYFVRGQGLW